MVPVTRLPTDRPMTLVIAAGDEATAAALAREFDDVGCTVAGAFPNAEKALRAVGELRPDAAVLDARLADEAALQLTLSLRQRKIRIIYFASYDPARNSLRAEMPDDPGLCHDTSIRALLRTLE